MNKNKWILIGLGGVAVWYFLIRQKPEPSGQAVDPQTGETSGSGWDVLGLLGSVSMD